MSQKIKATFCVIDFCDGNVKLFNKVDYEEKIDINESTKQNTWIEEEVFLEKTSLEKLEYIRKEITKLVKTIKDDVGHRRRHLDDYDGEEVLFNEDGECISGEEWNYPGSPYLPDEDDC